MIASLFKKQHRFSLSRALGVTIALVGLMAQGCIGDEENAGADESASDPTLDGTSVYSIKAYVRDGEDRRLRRVDFEPGFARGGVAAPERETDATRPDSSGTGNASKEQATVVESEDGSLQVSAWELVQRAILGCTAETNYQTWAYPRLDFLTAPPNWSLMIWEGKENDLPATCDAHLIAQQDLLCVASKLAEVSDAVEPITWRGAGIIPGGDTETIIPPQSEEDRFIVREHALMVLGQLARFMNKGPATVKVNGVYSPTLDASCAQHFKTLLANTSLFQTYTNAFPDEVDVTLPGGAVLGKLDGYSALGDHTIPNEPTRAQINVPALIPPRLRLQTHLARSAARLTKQLVEAGVRADLSGAEAFAARSLRDAWGLDPKKGNLPGYNTYRHALRLVLGSWEYMPPGTTPDSPYTGRRVDTLVGGTYNMRYKLGDKDLADALPGLDMRVGLVAPATSGQSLAWRAFRQSGLVIPNQQAQSASQIRVLLANLVLAQAAVQAGITTQVNFDAFKTSSTGRALTSSLNALTDQDVRFGADRALKIYSLLVGSITPVTAASSLLPAPAFAPPWGFTMTLGGFVVPKGIPETDLNKTAIGVFGYAARTSADSDVSVANGPDGHANASTALRVFRKTIRHMTGIAAVAEGVDSAAAEVDRLIASDGHILRVSGKTTNGGSTIYQTVIEVTGLDGATVNWNGVTSGAELDTRLTFVAGTALEAECRAGLRERCGGATAAPPTGGTATIAAMTGGFSLTKTFTFPSSVGSKMVWGVLLRTEDQPGVVFMVDRGDTNAYALALTDWERELLEAIQSGRMTTDKECSPVLDSRSAGYCIDGVARDTFIPVANALVGEGQDVDESWKHYLCLAKEASAKADELGRQLVDVGSTKDLRREQAQLALGELCGGLPDEGDVSPNEDTNLSQCLEEKTIDVVYFADVTPVEETPEPSDPRYVQIQSKARAELDATVCEGTGSSDLCDAAASQLSVRDLDFDTVAAEEESATAGWENDYCKQAFSDLPGAIGVASSKYDRQYYETLVNTGDLSEGAIAKAALRLSLDVDIDGNSWVLRRGSRALMAWVSWRSGASDPTLPVSSPSKPAPGVFGEFPGCLHLTLACKTAADPLGCCSPLAKEFAAKAAGTSPTTNITQDGWRRMLESALFRLGYAAGFIPEGMFEVPVPGIAWGGSATPALAPATFAPAAYFGNLTATSFRTITRLGEADAGWSAESKSTLVGDQGLLFLNEADVNLLPGIGPDFAATRTQNPTYGALLSSSTLATYRRVTLGRNRTINLLDAAEHVGDVTPQELFDFFSGTNHFPTAGKAEGLWDWDAADDAANLACFRGGYALLNGNIVYGGLEHFDLEDCTVNTEGVDFPPPSWPALAETLPSLPVYQNADPAEHYGRPSLSCPLYAMAFGPFALVPPDACFTTDANWRSSGEDTCATENRSSMCCPTNQILSGCRADHCEVVRDTNLGYQVLARECTPDDRTILAIDRGIAEEKAVPLAAFLTCVADGGFGADVAAPPVVRTPADAEMLRHWLTGQVELLAEAQEKMFAVSVPEAVVTYFDTDVVPEGVVGSGQRGDQILKMASALQNIERGFRVVRGGVQHMASALGAAEARFEAIELAGDQQLLSLAMQKVEASNQVAQASISMIRSALAGANIFAAMASFGTSVIDGTLGVMSGMLARESGMQTVALLDDSGDLSVLQEANENTQAVLELNDALLSAFREIEDGIGQISESQLTIQRESNAIESRENAAQVQKAMMMGEDFVDIDADGTPESLPMNTVYRRQYDVLRNRYKETLETAKRYAYYSRLAIEQRLGVRLADLDERIGSSPAPSSWVDSLCSLTGIDYEELRASCTSKDGNNSESCIVGTAEGLDEGEAIAAFTDQYVGDYVSQLEQFVENYNIDYPFQDSEDLAVVSLRDHVLGRGICDDEIPNLLASSGDLRNGPTPQLPGWSTSGCSDTLCLKVDEAVRPAAIGSMSLNAPVPPPLSPGGASFVRVSAPLPALPGIVQARSAQFPNTVYQRVQLQAGKTYELSWWDSSRSPTGTTGGTAKAYSALVTNSDWDPFVLDAFTTYPSAVGAEWSERRVLQFTVPLSADYYIGWQFLEAGVAAIANVQLVDLAAATSSASPYVNTNAQGHSQCTAERSPSVADAFRRRCYDGQCFFELKESFSLDEEDILGAAFADSGIPADNYNYRHLGVALNAVGTGIMDCEGQESSCFANGFLEYDLEHSAYRSRITNYGGEQECFSFGEGAIRRGKMLAAERVLGVPLSTTDEDLISGEDFLKPVLKGRPIDGAYRLRIYDRPGFNIEQLEDVQLVLKHVYWSRVERTPG